MRKLSALDRLKQQREPEEYNAWFVVVDKKTGDHVALQRMYIETDEDLDYLLSQQNENSTMKQITKEQYDNIMWILL